MRFGAAPARAAFGVGDEIWQKGERRGISRKWNSGK
jgi:hypothetical protein